MINFNQPTAYEHINFYSQDFPFGVYTIHNNPTLPHWHTHLELIYIQKGFVDVYINGNVYPCQKDSLIIIPKNNLHSIIPKEESTYSAIVIGDNLLDELKNDSHLLKILNIYQKISHPIKFQTSNGIPFYKKIVEPIKQIIEENHTKNSHYKIFIKLSLCNFFTTIYRYSPEIFSTKENLPITQIHYIKTAIEYLTENFDKKITINDICSLVNLSEQHFSRLFKGHTGKTFVEYLTLFRLEEAEKLLIQTNIPITQIPELTGFCNSNYFARVYKKQYNQTPSAIRKTRKL